MGNRAVITTAPYDENNIGIYVHWNGGQESIEGFLAACRQLEYRDPTTDCYGMARLTQAIGLFFGGSTSLGIDVNRNLDTNNGDNGTWLIGPGWLLAGNHYGAWRRLTAEQRKTSGVIAATIVAKTRAAEHLKL